MINKKMPQQVQLLGQGLEQRFVPIPLKGCTPFKRIIKDSII
jgi:hypothetical protein